MSQTFSKITCSPTSLGLLTCKNILPDEKVNHWLELFSPEDRVGNQTAILFYYDIRIFYDFFFVFLSFYAREPWQKSRCPTLPGKTDNINPILESKVAWSQLKSSHFDIFISNTHLHMLLRVYVLPDDCIQLRSISVADTSLLHCTRTVYWAVAGDGS